MATEENKVVFDCLDLLNRLPMCMAWRNNQINVRGRRFNGKVGVSDIIGCYKGRFLGVECKTKDGVLSPEQHEFLARIRGIGGIAIVATGVDDIIKELGL